MELLPGRPYPLGADVIAGGTNFAVSSEIAEAVEVCLFDDDGSEIRVELPLYQRAYLARVRSRCGAGSAVWPAGARALGA